MGLSRRGFLKAAAATAVMPIPKFKSSTPIKEEDFDPEGEYGNSLPCSSQLYNVENIKKILYDDMARVVPSKYHYRAQFMRKMTRLNTICFAWFYPISKRCEHVCLDEYENF